MAKIINPTKVVTGKNTRFSYLIVNEPKAINGGTPKYSVSLIIPKSDTVTVEKIKAAIKAAYEEGQGKLKGNGKTVPPLKAIKTPLRDGDEERPDDEAYAGCYFINANSATKPGVVDASCQPISIPASFTLVFTVVQASTSTRSTPTATRVSPAV